MIQSYSKIARQFICKSKLLFSLIILLVACPLWGQVNNNVKAYLEAGRLFFNINEVLLQKPMLFVRHGMGEHQIIWSKQPDHILLTLSQIHSLSGVVIPLENNYRTDEKILGRFPIIKEKSSSQSFYIDVTDLLLQTAINWNLESPETVVVDQSYIKGIRYCENETVIMTKRTTSYGEQRNTKDVDFSFFMLPDPMEPRLFDHRMGYFCEDQYSAINAYPKHAKASIMRWRLEKKHKNKKVSEPIKPIVFYFDPTMPDKWKPYVRAGVLEWLPAFEAAGFKNAIQVKEIPKYDENWLENSVDRSMIRWSNYAGIRGSEGKGGSTVRQIVDLRSGEILKSDIILGSSYQDLSDQYFVRCAPLDKRSLQYPFPDDLMGELIQFVTAHEAGHAFGLRDANYGEYAYPFEKMRDKNWLKKMGHTPSVMTYARHNYIVQPEDNVPPSLLIQKVGPADVYQITWGYQIIPDSTDPNEDLSYLEKFIRQQDSIAWYRYNIGYTEILGPGATDEVVDNDDPVKSTEFGLRNIKSVLELLPQVNHGQKDNALLERLYTETLELWYQQMQRVTSLIGGYTIQYKSGSQKGDVYSPIPRKSQEEALDFLLNNAFEVPEWLSRPNFLLRIQYSSNSDKLIGYQLKLLSELLDSFRMKRLEQMEVTITDKEITMKLMSKLRTDLFKELDDDGIRIGKRRQQLQSAYIALCTKAIAEERIYSNMLNNESYYLYSYYSKSILTQEVLALKKEILNKLETVPDGVITGHLKLCLRQIEILSL